MAVKTKSIYEPAAKEDGTRVLITRYYPRGVKKDRFDRWVKPLSPSRDLLSSYKDGKRDWDEFKKLFLAEIRSSQESIDALRTINELSKAHDVTLLCYEKTGLPCHRLLVQEILSTRSLLSRYVKPRTLPKNRGTAKSPSTRIRFYPRRKLGRKAPK